MSETQIYELINPSDAITFRATKEEASVIAGIVGASLLFVKDVETGEAPNTEGWQDARERFWKDSVAFDSYCRAYESFLVGSPKDRELFEDAVRNMGADEAAEYRLKWHNRKCSSMNDICARFWEAAKGMRERGVDAPEDH